MNSARKYLANDTIQTQFEGNGFSHLEASHPVRITQTPSNRGQARIPPKFLELPEQSVQMLNKLSETQRHQLYEKFLQVSTSTRPDSAFTRTTEMDMSNFDQELMEFLRQVTGVTDLQLEPSLSSFSNSRQNSSLSKNYPLSDQGEQKLNFKKLSKKVETKKISKRYQDDEPQVFEMIQTTKVEQPQPSILEMIEAVEQPSPTFVKSRRVQEQKDTQHFFWHSFEQFFENINHLCVKPQDNLPKIIENVNEEQQQDSRKLICFKDERIPQIIIRQEQEASSMGSNNREYPDTQQEKLLTYDQIWGALRLGNQELFQPYIKKTQEKQSFCRRLFRCLITTPQQMMTLSQQREKRQVISMQDIQLDLSCDLHRTMLLVLSYRLGKYQGLRVPSERWMSVGFRREDPRDELATTGIFGLVQILAALEFYPDLMNSYLQLRQEFPNLMLCDLMLKISQMILKLLTSDQLDHLIMEYNSVINGINQLFAALLYKLIGLQRKKHPGFEEKAVNAMLFAFAKNSEQTITIFVKQFSKEVSDISKEM